MSRSPDAFVTCTGAEPPDAGYVGVHMYPRKENMRGVSMHIDVCTIFSYVVHVNNQERRKPLWRKISPPLASSSVLHPVSYPCVVGWLGVQVQREPCYHILGQGSRRQRGAF